MSKRIMNETELANAMDSLPRHIKPQRDLWPDINERLEKFGRGNGSHYQAPLWRMPAMAAAIMLALTGGIFIGRGIETEPLSAAPQMAIENAMLGTVAATEREYQAAFSELVPLDYSGLLLGGEEPDALRESWEDLLHTESSLLAALREFPQDIFLNEKLLDLRSQQLQFVKQLAMLEQNNWRRT